MSKLLYIAGPCSIDTEENLATIAHALSNAGVPYIRAGAFKPRTSPYTFKGLGAPGLAMLQRVATKYGLTTVSEVTTINELPLFNEYIDVLQIGARNMQNFPLLEAAASLHKPMIIKRGFMSTIDEFLYAAEYAVSCGNEKIILCERGIRTFQQEARFSLDITAIPILQEKTHFPVIVDPSHSTGNQRWVERVSYAAIAAGANGLMLETHILPHMSLSDEQQIIDLDTMSRIVKTSNSLHQTLYEK